MRNIIITITNEEHRFFYDVEVPIDLELDKLLDDIVQTLNGYNPALYLNTFSVELFNERTRKILLSNQTMNQAGVRNGDYISIQRKVKDHARDYI